MAGLVNDLIAVLNKETGVYEELTLVAEQKKEIIINNDIEGLRATTAKEHGLVSKVSRLDRERLRIIDDIALVLNIRAEEITLKLLADVIKGQPEAEELKECTENITKCLSRLKALNDQNGRLLQSSLDYVDFTINLIRGSMKGTPDFMGADGDIADTGAGFFDIKN